MDQDLKYHSRRLFINLSKTSVTLVLIKRNATICPFLLPGNTRRYATICSLTVTAREVGPYQQLNYN